MDSPKSMGASPVRRTCQLSRSVPPRCRGQAEATTSEMCWWTVARPDTISTGQTGRAQGVGCAAKNLNHREGGGRTHLLPVLATWPWTTHPFRDGASFLLLTETPPTFGRSLRFFHVTYFSYTFLDYLILSCFAV